MTVIRRIKSEVLPGSGHLLYMRKFGRFYNVQVLNPHTGEPVVEVEPTKNTIANLNYN